MIRLNGTNFQNHSFNSARQVSQLHDDARSHWRTRTLHPFRKTAVYVASIAGGLFTLLLCARVLHWISAAMIATVLSTMAFGQAASQASLQAAKRPDPAIIRAAETYRKAVLDADTNRVLAVYRDDATEMPPFQPPVIGKAAIERFYQQMFGGPIKVTEFTLTHAETTAQGDIAYDVGSYTRTMTGAPTGPVHAAGTYVVILKRSGEDWKIAYSIYNCDCPPPTPLSQRE